MNLDFLNDFMIPVIFGICLILGYLIKSWDKVPNKWIPTIVAVIGVIIALWVNAWAATPEIILQGLASGLASCGAYDAYKHLISEQKIGTKYDNDENLIDVDTDNTEESEEDGEEKGGDDNVTA